MQGVHLRKYGVEATIDFEVYEITGVDLNAGWVPAAADCEIMKDGGAETQCTNTAIDEGSTFSIVLTATEMQAARLVLKVVDAATKVILDKVLVIETYGNASAQHAFDLDDSVRGGMTALPNAAADAAGGLAISDAGGLDLDTKLANTNEITVARMGSLTDWINGGRLDLLLDAIKAVTDLLPDSGALTAIGTDTARLTAVRAEILTDWINGGRLDLLLDAIPTTAMRGTDGANTTVPDAAGTAPTAVEIRQEMDSSSTGLAAIFADTDELVTNQGNWLTATGFSTHSAADIWSVASRLLTAGTNIVLAKGVGVTGFNDLSATQVNTEVLDVFTVDTFGEPGDETPAAANNLAAKIGYIYKFSINKLETTATRIHVYDSAGTNKDHSSIISDDGTTFTRGKFTLGDA